LILEIVNPSQIISTITHTHNVVSVEDLDATTEKAVSVGEQQNVKSGFEVTLREVPRATVDLLPPTDLESPIKPWQSKFEELIADRV
jgi:hypothetical protein